MPAVVVHGAVQRSPDDCSNDGSVCLAQAWLMRAGTRCKGKYTMASRGFMLAWL
jgi:hypothetical protein